MTKRLDIQILRGLAVLGVVLNHVTTRVSGGFIGVDIFFVISGFLIAQMLRSQVHPFSLSDYQKFIVRRSLRLFPALIFVSIIICVATIFLNNPSGTQQNAAKTAISTNLFFGNLVIQSVQSNYFADNALYNPLMHFWTLSVEWQFYLTYPVALVVTKRLMGRNKSKFGHYFYSHSRKASIFLSDLEFGNFSLELCFVIFHGRICGRLACFLQSKWCCSQCLFFACSRLISIQNCLGQYYWFQLSLLVC